MSVRKKSGLGRQAGALFPQTPPVDDLFSPTTAPAAPAAEAGKAAAQSTAAPATTPAADMTHNGATRERAATAVMPEPVLPPEAESAPPGAVSGAAEQPEPVAPRRPGRPPAPVGPGGPKKIKSTSLRVEEGLYKRFRQICLAKDVTVQVAIEEAIRNYIEDAERGE